MSYVVNCNYSVPLEEYSKVEFVMDTGETLHYKVIPWFLNLEGSGYNSKIFSLLGIKDKEAFIQDIVGYRSNGNFPAVRNADDLLKVIRALVSYRGDSPKRQDDKFTLTVKKHKQTKLNFNL